MHSRFVFVIFCFSSFNSASLEVAPDKFPACSRSDPNLGDCLLNTLNLLRNRFPSGKLASNFVIDPLDPFYLNEFVVLNAGPIRWVMHDMSMTGVTGFKLEKILTSVDGNKLRVKDFVVIPKVDMKTKYNIRLPTGISLKGDLYFSLINFKVHGDTGVVIYKRDGVEYAMLDSVKLTIDSTQLDNVRFSLPIGRVRELGFFSKAVLRVFGERMTKIAYRIVESKVDRIHIDTVNRFLKDIPAAVFLPA